MTGQLQLGLTAGVPEALYHRGIVDGEPSLSHSGMKTLLGRTPLHYRHEVDHPEDRVEKRSFDLGSAAHAYILGSDAGIAEIRMGAPTDEHPYGSGPAYDSYRTKDAQTKRDRAYAEDLTPILARDVSRVQAMVQALRSHARAAELLEAGSGIPEVSGFARDPESGVLLRARFDWLRHDGIAVDYKSAGRTADPATFGRLAWDYGYFLQDPTYRHVAALCDASISEFHFVIQETSPPFAVSVTHLGPATLELGRRRMREAITRFSECVAAGVWPGYPDASVEVDVPYWALRDLETVPGDDDEAVIDSAALQLLESLN